MPCNRRMNHCGRGPRGFRRHPYGPPHWHPHPAHLHPLFATMMDENIRPNKEEEDRGANRCGRGGGFRGHPFGPPHGPPGFPHPAHFHPLFAMMVGDAFHPNNEEEEEQIAASVLGKDKSRWNDNESNFVFQMDVPGVKGRHVTIEEKDGEMEVTAIRMNGDEVLQTYQDVFYVKPSKVDLSNVLATLDEGVLTIVVPKKKAEPVQVPVKVGVAPEPTESEFRASWDLPGVKTAALKVQIRGDKVHIEAYRQVGERTMNIHRVLPVEPSNTNVDEAKAFLQDGVLTLVAPLLEDDADDDMSKPGAVRIIHVQEEVSGMEGLSLEEEENNVTYAEAKVVVETVTEGDQDWEEVKAKASEKQD